MDQWGVDVGRIAMFFFAPSEDEIKWKETGLGGARRFLQRFWDRVQAASDGEDSRDVQRKLHQVIRKVTHSMDTDLHFNTSIAAIMEFMNVSKEFSGRSARALVQLMAPLAPFMAEELWEALGNEGSVFRAGWPEYDEELAREEEREIVVQVNGKVRNHFTAVAGTSDDELRSRALQLDVVQQVLQGKEPRKVIVVKDRLVNIVA